MKKRRRPGTVPSAPPEESGAIVKPGRGLTRVALVYPNTYKAGMSSLGFQTVYRLANLEDDIACERIFLPDTRQPPSRIKSLESGLPLDQFDLILFSISFENDFYHLAQLLGAAGIPLRSSDRNAFHLLTAFPLIVAGGVACSLNPEPIAPFTDLFLLGEAECLLPEFFEAFRQAQDKATLLDTVEEQVSGAYVPARHPPLLYPDSPPPATRIPVQYLNDLAGIKTTTTVMTSGAAFKDTFLVETLKGCPHGCRFCTAGFIYRPPRVYPVDTLMSAIDEAAEKTDRLGIVSSAVLDHPKIADICQYGRDKGMRLSFSSLRADRLTGQILSILADAKVRTATIAPEAGSGRMRKIINKKLNRNQILDAARRLVDKGIINLRLYFMIGLPFETREDVEAIVDLAKAIKAVFLATSRKKKKIGTITLSINPFIPKPSTPFQWCAMLDEKELLARKKIIAEGLKKTANVKVNFESFRKAKVDALLSLGDRNAADLIEDALETGWTRAVKKASAYVTQVIYTEKPNQATTADPPALPWEILAHPVSDDFLLKEYLKAKDEKQSAACPMKDCRDCGVCIPCNRW